MMLFQITAVVFAAENATNKVSENISGNLTQKDALTKAPVAPPAGHSEPMMPGFEATFAVVSFLAVSFIIFRRRI